MTHLLLTPGPSGMCGFFPRVTLQFSVGEKACAEWAQMRRHGRGSCAGQLGILPTCREKAMAPHSSTVAQKIPWMEEPGRLQSMGSLRVRHD